MSKPRSKQKQLAVRLQFIFFLFRLLNVARKQKNRGSGRSEFWNELVHEPLQVLCSSQGVDRDVVNVQENYMSEAQVLASITQFQKRECDENTDSSQPITIEHEHLSEFERSDVEFGVRLSEVEFDLSNDDSDTNQGTFAVTLAL